MGPARQHCLCMHPTYSVKMGLRAPDGRAWLALKGIVFPKDNVSTHMSEGKRIVQAVLVKVGADGLPNGAVGGGGAENCRCFRSL